MKRLVLLLLVLVACAPMGSRQLTGAPDARTAVETFLAAVRAQDLQAMSVIWGTTKGPARDQIPRDELEKRELLMMCYFSHDTFRILQEAPGTEGRRVFRVELTRGPLTRATNFFTIQGPSSRWYVESADMIAARDLCREPPSIMP